MLLLSYTGGASKICQSSSDESFKKVEEEKRGLVAKVRHLEAQLKLSFEKEKKTSERNQVLERKFEDFEQQRPFDRDMSQVKLTF